MRYWRVVVKPGDGRHFFSRIEEISESRAVVRGDRALPAGTVCDLHIGVPSWDGQKPALMAGLQVEVDEVIFSSAGVRLALKVRSLDSGARRLIAERNGDVL